MTDLFLPNRVYLSFTPDGAIFLDIGRDKYFGLGSHQAELLRTLIDSTGRQTDEHDQLVAELLQSGLLTLSAKGSRALAPTGQTGLGAPILTSIDESSPRVTIWDVTSFLLASTVAWCVLHVFSLEFAIRRLQARTARGRRRPRRAPAEESMRRLLSVFVYLRPLLYASKDQCLFDSLALVEFLNWHGLQATCVLGVKTLPFEAHCWVQTDRFLLIDGNPDRIATFSPICYA